MTENCLCGDHAYLYLLYGRLLGIQYWLGTIVVMHDEDVVV